MSIEEGSSTAEQSGNEPVVETGNEPEAKTVNPEPKTEEKPKISDAEAKLLKELMKHKEAAKEAAAKAKALEDKFAGVDVEEFKKIIAEREENETKELERKGEYDRLLEKQREKANAAIEAERKAKEEASNQLTQLMQRIDEMTVSTSFANSKFITENLALTPNKTRALYGDHFEVKDGQLVAYDKPKGAANRTPIVDASGNPADFETAIGEIINADPDKDYLLKSVNKGGAGSKPNQHEAKPSTEMDSLQKIAEGLKTLKVER